MVAGNGEPDRRTGPPTEEPPYDEAWGGRILSLLGRFGRWTAIALGLLLLLVAAGVFTLTETGVGRDVVRDFVQDRLQGAVAEGEVRIGRIIGGNLLTRVVVDSFVIDGPRGRPFVALDSVRLEYDPSGFLRSDFVFREMEVGTAALHLLQYEDGTWNFRRIFRGGDGPGRTRLVFHDVHLRSGQVVVRQPYPASGVTGEAREEALREAVRGETIWRIERSEADGGFERVIELLDMRARFPMLRLTDPDAPMRIEIGELAGEARALTQPLDVREFTGSVTFRDSVHTVIDNLRLPASRLSGAGWIVAGDTAQEYRFDLRGDPVGFSDLQWLPVPVPEEGGGPMDVVLRTEAGEPVVEVSDGDIRVRDTRIRGGFTLALPETPRFDALDLRFTPLRIGLVERLLDRPDPAVDGTVTGTLSGSGPIDRMRIDASGALHPPEGGAPSAFEAHGAVSLVEPYRLTSLRLRLRDFSPTWARLAGREPELGGRVSGTALLDGVPGGRLALEVDLTHTRADGTVSAVRGGGSADFSGQAPAVDVSVVLDPLALGLLDPWFPDLGLVGSVRGTVAARGRFSDLQARADLETPRGQLAFEGRFDLVSDTPTYDARVTARGIELDQWAEDFPETRLAVTGRVEGRGTDPATLRATFDLRILPSTVAGAEVDTSAVRFTLSEGLAHVDTLAVDSDVGRVRGRGAFGLVEERSGSLVLDVTVPRLAEWNRWLGTPPDSAPAGQDLFAVFDQPLGQDVAGEEGEPADTLAGAVEARGVVFGNVHDFSFGGQVTGRGLVYDGYAADSLVARLDVADPETRDSLTVNASSWGLRAGGTRFDSVSGRLQRLGGDSAAVRLAAVRDTTLAVAVAGGVRWGELYAASVDSFRLEAGDHRLVLEEASTIVYGDSGLVVRDLVLRGGRGELLRADGRIPRTGSGEFVLSLEDLHLEELLSLLPTPPDADGTLGGEIRVWGSADAPSMEGSLRIADPSFAAARYPLLESEFRYDDRRAEGSLVLHGEAGPLVRVEGTVRADLALVEVEDRLPEDALDLRVSADSLPLQVLELAVQSLTQIRGSLRGNVRVTGGPGDLGFDGQVVLQDAAATVPNLGARFTGIRGGAALAGSEARLDSLVLRTGERGRATATGTVGLSEFTNPSFELTIRARDLQAMNTREMSFDVDGELELTGSYRSPTLAGSARISDGEIQQQDILRRGDVVDLTDPEIYSLIDTTVVAERLLFRRAQNPFMRNLRVSMDLAVGPDLWVRSPTLDVEVAGEGLEVRMNRADDQLQVTGTVRLVRGTYVFDRFGLQQELRITSGTIDFVGTPGINPNLDISAVYRTRAAEGPVTITAHVGGTMDDYQLTLESDPPTLSESDRLCFLAMGAPCFAATDPDVAQRLGTEVALGALGSGLSSAVVGDIGLADVFSLRTAATGGTGAASRGFFAGTELEVGKYLGNEFFVTYTQPLGGYGVSEATVEWRFSEDWTLEARTGSILGRRTGSVPASSLEDLRTYGLFIFREWSF